MIKNLGSDNTLKLFKFIVEASKLNGHKVIPINGNTSYVKYTSKSTMYKILESDSIFFTCSELSNDTTENKLLSLRNDATFITCFYHSNPSENTNIINSSDVYSQWMSYCSGGGAALEFYFGQDIMSYEATLMSAVDAESRIEEEFKRAQEKCILDYSLLYKDATNSSDYIYSTAFPFQVQYYTNTPDTPRTFNNQIIEIANKCEISEEQIAPFFKHSGFVQECEARLAFVNYNNQLSKCISFMEKPDGTMLPYIKVKFGSNDRWNSPCDYTPDQRIGLIDSDVNNRLVMLAKRNPRFPIIIPQGRDQEKIFEDVTQKLENYEDSGFKIPVICQGHLPITKITLAPTPDRAEQRKMMEIYCQSKYWLRKVEIRQSEIPYNMQNTNHT